MVNSTLPLSKSLRIRAEDLRLGMFVAELDRPWLKSPFLLQGFLLTEALDLSTMQLLLKECVIDPSKSDPKSLLHIPFDLLHERSVDIDALVAATALRRSDKNRILVVEQRNRLNSAVSWLHRLFLGSKTPLRSLKDRDHLARDARKISGRHPYAPDALSPYLRYHAEPLSSNTLQETPPPSTPQFTALLQSLYPRDLGLASLNWWERWQSWREQNHQASGSQALHKRTLKRRKKRPGFVPDDFPLFEYVDQVPMHEEMPRAQYVVDLTEALIRQLQSDLQNLHSLELKEVMLTMQLLAESVVANPSAMMWLMRMRAENSQIVGHALKVAVYIVVLGRHIGFSKQHLVELGFIGLLLDIGKLEMPEELLRKPEKLSSEEASIIRTHVNAGITLLESTEPLGINVKLGINQHHERMDGSGYPHGLVGKDISIFGRMAAIADSFSAMTSDRPYDITRSSFDAMKELFKMAGEQLHEPLVEEFVQAVGIFPVGSLVQLTTGEVAIVFEHNKIRRLDPKVLLLTNAEKIALEKPVVFDLMRQDSLGNAQRISIFRGLPDGAYGLVYHDFYKAF